MSLGDVVDFEDFHQGVLSYSYIEPFYVLEKGVLRILKSCHIQGSENNQALVKDDVFIKSK